MIALAHEGSTLPIGPGFQVHDCPVSDKILDVLPWDQLTDVRFVGTGVTYDAVAEKIAARMKCLVIFDRGYRIAQHYQWWPGRGYEPDGLSVWIEQDPVTLSTQQLGTLKNLSCVFLARKKPAGDLLDRLPNDKITYFELMGVPQETPVIEQISNWKHLQEAILNCCNPRTSFSMQPLAKLQKLRRLEFYCTPFGDEALESFGKISQLQELKISAGNKIQGPGLKHLKNLKHLKMLVIQSKANWDASFEHLMALGHVDRIRLINVGLSTENLKTYDAIPGRSHIVWK